MDKIINWFLLVIIFVFDPLAISLVIAANFAFSQIRKNPPSEDDDELTDDDREWLEANLEEESNIEWEEASLTNLQDLKWDGYGNPYPIVDEKPKQTGVPVMVDPKTGKFFYEEPDQEFKNLDLDGDGVVEKEELQQVFDEADTNDDGVIDVEEAKAANLSIEDTSRLNQYNESLEKLEKITNSFTSAEYGKKMEILEEVNNLKNLLISQFKNKKDDENTITYF
jgi:hypothetical protein